MKIASSRTAVGEKANKHINQNVDPFLQPTIYYTRTLIHSKRQRRTRIKAGFFQANLATGQPSQKTTYLWVCGGTKNPVVSAEVSFFFFFETLKYYSCTTGHRSLKGILSIFIIQEEL